MAGMGFKEVGPYGLSGEWRADGAAYAPVLALHDVMSLGVSSVFQSIYLTPPPHAIV